MNTQCGTKGVPKKTRKMFGVHIKDKLLHQLLNILISDAHGFDHCARGEVIRKIKQQGYWSPYLHATVDEYLATCEVCAKNNVRKGITTPIGHIPVPEGPFKHLVMDYVDMIKRVQGKRYMLVVIDRFSRWVEAVPSADQGAGTVITFLTREVIPRFGIPSKISSDSGSAFIQKTVKQVLQQLQMKLRSYMRKLTAIHKAIYLQEIIKEPREETESECPIVPGDQVYRRVFRSKWNDPRREGPYKEDWFYEPNWKSQTLTSDEDSSTSIEDEEEV